MLLPASVAGFFIGSVQRSSEAATKSSSIFRIGKLRLMRDFNDRADYKSRHA